jgi:PTH1 family peptidyl-tRNA hydrolase
MSGSRLIVGLGNPGREYARTRHNAGFQLAERVAAEAGAGWRVEARFRARLARATLAGESCWLCEPLTYMNLSGEAVGAVMRYHRLTRDRLLVLVDDADLPLGQLRLRPGGSAGGHHGLESVERHVGGRDYARLRLGIGRRPEAGRNITGHVLGTFNAEEWELFETVLARAASQVLCWVAEGVAAAMNRYNGTVEVPDSKDN